MQQSGNKTDFSNQNVSMIHLSWLAGSISYISVYFIIINVFMYNTDRNNEDFRKQSMEKSAQEIACGGIQRFTTEPSSLWFYQQE